MNIDEAIIALRTAQPFNPVGCPYQRVILPTAVVKVLAKHTNDGYLRRRLEDAAEWNEPTLRIHAEDRVRLLAVLA